MFGRGRAALSRGGWAVSLGGYGFGLSGKWRALGGACFRKLVAVVEGVFRRRIGNSTRVTG